MVGEATGASTVWEEKKGNGEALEPDVYMFATSVLARRQR
jgi:hypothetical protein